MESRTFPKVILVTPAAIDGKYAGGEVIRKIVKALPKGSVWWCGLKKRGNGKVENVVEEKTLSYPEMHWRFRRNSLALLLRAQLGARQRAKQIVLWTKSFHPNVLWVLAEEEGVNVAFFLHKLLKLPMHLTFHDVPEIFARQFAMYPGLYTSFYLTRVITLVKKSSSYDTVSEELGDYIEKFAVPPNTCRKITFPPSVSTENTQRAKCYSVGQSLRRICLCGSLRVSQGEWKVFLTLLGSLPFNFELIVFSDPQYFPAVSLPQNVTIIKRDYQATENDLICQLINEQAHACYLGLWREENKRLFCQTSLSSKLATYTATGLPVIVDGPEDSVVWSLVKKYAAGVLLKENAVMSCLNENSRRMESKDILMKLFDDVTEWQRLAAGAGKLWKEELNMDKNILRFVNVITQI
jgi:hypothetical protein